MCGKIAEDIKAGAVLKIIYHRSDDETISLPMVYAGSADTIFRDLFLKNSYITVITITLTMMGIFSLLVAVITWKQPYDYRKKLLMLGAFLFLMGSWCITDSPLIQYLLDYSNTNMYMDFFIFLFLVIPFVGYIKNIKGMEQYRILRLIILASFYNAIAQTVLEVLDVFTYIEMVPATHIMIVVGMLTSICLLCWEYRISKNREVFLCIRAFAIAGGFAVFSIVMYFMKPEIFYQNLLQTGFLQAAGRG